MIINTNKQILKAGKFVSVPKEEAVQLLEAYAAILNIDIRGKDRVSIWHDDMWFYTEDPNHKFLYEYMMELGFSGYNYADSEGDDRFIIKYHRFVLNKDIEFPKPLSQSIQELSWEQIARWKLANPMPISQPNNKSFISTLSSWLTSEKLFGSMNKALWFALKTWRQLKKRPLNSIATGIVISCVLAIALTLVT